MGETHLIDTPVAHRCSAAICVATLWQRYRDVAELGDEHEVYTRLKEFRETRPSFVITPTIVAESRAPPLLSKLVAGDGTLPLPLHSRADAGRVSL